MKALIIIMASINTNKADKIMLYLRGQGYARGGAEKLGPDIVQFLEDNGHTFMGNARRQLENMSTSQWSNMQRDLWVAGNPQVEALFGLNPYELESLYMSHLNRINSKAPGIIPGDKTTGSTGVGGAKGGTGLIKPSYAFNGYNGTGWDNINLLNIAEHGSLNDDYVVKMKNLRTNPLSAEFEQVRTNLTKGSALGSYGRTPPVVSASAPATTTAPVTEDDEEEEEEEEVVIAPIISYEWDLALTPLTLTDVIGTSSEIVPTVEVGERKVSSKAYGELDSTKTIPVLSGIIEIEMKTLPKTQGIQIMDVTFDNEAVTRTTKPTPMADYDALMVAAIADGSAFSNILTDEDGDEYEDQLLVAPDVKFLVNVDEGKVYIVINGQMMVASKGHDEYTFTDCAIRVMDPSTKGSIEEVLLDGVSMQYGKWIPKAGNVAAHFDYGFPLNGVEGLPPTCYEDTYEWDEVDVNENPTALISAFMGDFITEGGRPIIFGKSKKITFDLEGVDERFLQALALNFDIKLEEDDAVVFVLNYGGKLNYKTNLFPGQMAEGFTGFSELQMFSYPNDISNVRPLDEESVVMLQTFNQRKVGEGISHIMVDSSNLKDTITFPISGVDYVAQVYTQVQVTFDSYKSGKKEVDEASMEIPDGDMRFRGMDNSNAELQGEVTSLEEASEMANVLVIQGKAQEIYEALEEERHAARISSKYNVIDKIDKQIITKTLLLEQTVTSSDDRKESMYYLIIGTGNTTKVIKMDMGDVVNE